jgi:hypothetical protein
MGKSVRCFFLENAAYDLFSSYIQKAWEAFSGSFSLVSIVFLNYMFLFGLIIM